MGYFLSYQDGPNIFCDVSQTDCVIKDSKARITCAEFTILECGDPNSPCSTAVVNNGLIVCDCGDVVNCDLCSNDLPYFNIVNPGDILYFQFQQIDLINDYPNNPFTYGWGNTGMAQGFIKDCCTGDYLEDGLGNPVSVLDYAVDSFVGAFPKYDYKGEATPTFIQTISIDTDALCQDLIAQFPNGNGCFQFEFCFNYSNPSLRYCICTEQYRCNPCPEKKNTILLEGQYPYLDCFRYYYGTEAVGIGTFSYRNQYRVEGSLEQNGFEITKEFVGTKQYSVSSETMESWLLRTNRIPAKVARIITNIMASEIPIADNKDFIVDGEILKNNDIGNQWFIDVNMKRLYCSKTYSCK